jgi:dTMP kinase
MKQTYTGVTSGQFFVIDGTDGSGKATQTKRLVERFQQEGFEVETISFPQYERPTSGAIKEYLSGTYGSVNDVSAYVGSMMYALDRYDGSFKIKKWLSEGKVVVADRFVSSNMGHQGCKIKDTNERTAYLKWNEQLEYEIFKLPRPTMTIVLAVSADIGSKLARQGAKEKTKVRGDIHEHDIDHLRASEATYREIALRFQGFNLIECVQRNELRDRDDIHEEIWKTVCTKLPSIKIKNQKEVSRV